MGTRQMKIASSLTTELKILQAHFKTKSFCSVMTLFSVLTTLNITLGNCSEFLKYIFSIL